MPHEELAEKAVKFNDTFVAFADRTSQILEEATAAGGEDLDPLREGLRDAIDTGVLLQNATDQGVDVTESLINSVERLIRATLKTQPALVRRELDHTLDGDDPNDEKVSLTSALRSRSSTASVELHRGLEGAYRNYIDMETER